jgi:hypothetical protein
MVRPWVRVEMRLEVSLEVRLEVRLEVLLKWGLIAPGWRRGCLVLAPPQNRDGLDSAGPDPDRAALGGL